MNESNELKKRILDQLRMIHDPATSLDVVRMRLIKSICVKEGGQVQLTIKPTSNICPIIAKLTTTIKTVVEVLDGVNKVEMKLIDRVDSEMLNQLLNE